MDASIFTTMDLDQNDAINLDRVTADMERVNALTNRLLLVLRDELIVDQAANVSFDELIIALGSLGSAAGKLISAMAKEEFDAILTDMVAEVIATAAAGARDQRRDASGPRRSERQGRRHRR